MSNLLVRAWPTDAIEIRSEGSQRVIEGLAVPYDTPTEIADRSGTYTEVFRHGAFTQSIRQRGDRIRLFGQHDRSRFPIGKATNLAETREGLMATFKVASTSSGDDALALIREGMVEGLSIGFRPVNDRWSKDRKTVERLQAALMEVSLVNEPAYPSARVLAMRQQAASDARNRFQKWMRLETLR